MGCWAKCSLKLPASSLFLYSSRKLLWSGKVLKAEGSCSTISGFRVYSGRSSLPSPAKIGAGGSASSPAGGDRLGSRLACYHFGLEKAAYRWGVSSRAAPPPSLLTVVITTRSLEKESGGGLEGEVEENSSPRSCRQPAAPPKKRSVRIVKANNNSSSKEVPQRGDVLENSSPRSSRQLAVPFTKRSVSTVKATSNSSSKEVPQRGAATQEEGEPSSTAGGKSKKVAVKPKIQVSGGKHEWPGNESSLDGHGPPTFRRVKASSSKLVGDIPTSNNSKPFEGGKLSTEQNSVKSSRLSGIATASASASVVSDLPLDLVGSKVIPVASSAMMNSNQNFHQGGFNFFQLNSVAQGALDRGLVKKPPLIILHHARNKFGAANSPLGQQLLRNWSSSNTLYATPNGSNDWYWMYAALRHKSLLITNDEMRDYRFQLLGSDFFPKWKERHQVRFSATNRGPQFHLPRHYSLVIQGGQTCPETVKTQRRSKSSKANRSFLPEATDESFQDTTGADDSDNQFQLGGVADEADNVIEEMEEVLSAMTSGLQGNLPVVSNSVCVGIDPDLSGAIAVLKSRDNCTIAEVIDVPCITVAVNKKMRRRHDYQSIASMVNQLRAPQGSIAYVEQAIPFPKDGKQGWFITGYGYGVWLGILAAAGFTVVPVQARAWKTAMGICGKEFTKDDSRALASSMFPVLSAQLRRKKDHGRAEALLIAAFGKGMTVTKVAPVDEPYSLNRIESPDQPASLTAILSSHEPPF